MDDEALTGVGLAPSGGAARVLIIACGALAHEIIALKRMNKWDHVDLTCLPAILHNHPEQITDKVRQAIATHREAYDDIFVAYADCGTGGQLAEACQELGVQMIKGPHCYAFFEGLDVFGAHEDEITAFYVTDFLARQFDAFVWRPLGLDRHPELRDMYFGNYTKLVYLTQKPDPVLADQAREHAKKLGLAFELRETGYGDLSVELNSWVGAKDS